MSRFLLLEDENGKSVRVNIDQALFYYDQSYDNNGIQWSTIIVFTGHTVPVRQTSEQIDSFLVRA